MPDFQEGFAAFFADAPLIGLFIYSFLSATLLPGGSEVALAVYLLHAPGALWSGICLATLGNTLGGLTSYYCGRYMPENARLAAFRSAWHGERLARLGAPMLLLAWLPLVGDLLCLAAGWLRLNWLACVFFMGIGKFLRYCLVGQAALSGFAALQ